MSDVLSYHVLHGTTGKWLDSDEHNWTPSFIDSAGFTESKLAQDVGEREAGPKNTIYVMACLGYIAD